MGFDYIKSGNFKFKGFRFRVVGLSETFELPPFHILLFSRKTKKVLHPFYVNFTLEVGFLFFSAYIGFSVHLEPDTEGRPS